MVDDFSDKGKISVGYHSICRKFQNLTVGTLCILFVASLQTIYFCCMLAMFFTVCLHSMILFVYIIAFSET